MELVVLRGRPHRAQLSVGAIAGLAGLLGVTACDRSSTTLSTPTDPKCEVSASISVPSTPPGGGSGTVSVTTTRDCTWTASSEAPWVTITGSRTGQGSGTTEYAVAANADPAPRQTNLAVNDARLRVAQEAACTFAVAPTALSFGAAGAVEEVRVTTGGTCEWSTAAQADWIGVSDGGTGPGVVTVAAPANTAGPRSGQLIVAGQTVRVQQAGLAVEPCRYAIDPTAQVIGPSGGEIEVAVTAGPACTWSAAPGVPWIAVARGATGVGRATVALTVAPGSIARVGTVVIAGQTLTVTQTAAPCTYRLDRATAAMPASGGTGTVDLITPSACAWEASSSEPSWLAVTGPTAGAGPATIGFTATPNDGPARSGTVIVGGQTLTVTQPAAPCTYALDRAAAAMPASSGSGTVELMTRDACAWTASTSEPSWLLITSPASGAGPASIGFTVAPNDGPARSGVLTIGGQTFTVTQAAVPAICSYVLDPLRVTVPSTGGRPFFVVTTASACSWTATTTADWITIPMPGGTGSGSVTFSVAPNGNRRPRSGPIVVAGQTVLVVQEGDD